MLKITLKELENMNINDVYVYAVIRDRYNFKTKSSKICKTQLKQICRMSIGSIDKTIKRLLYNNSIIMLNYGVVYDIVYLKNKYNIIYKEL